MATAAATATATAAAASSWKSLCVLPTHSLTQSHAIATLPCRNARVCSSRFISRAAPPDQAVATGSTGTYQVIEPLNGDPFVGSLETPVTSSPLVAWYLSNLPAYRTAVRPLLRGVEVGLAHGFLLVGPFVKTGPLRDTPYAANAGSLAAGGLVVILSLCLTMYGIASFNEGEPSKAPCLTLTGRQKQPDPLQTADGWADFTGGFFFGGISGVAWAYILLYVLNLPYYVK